MTIYCKITYPFGSRFYEFDGQTQEEITTLAGTENGTITIIDKETYEKNILPQSVIPIG